MLSFLAFRHSRLGDRNLLDFFLLSQLIVDTLVVSIDLFLISKSCFSYNGVY